ncbi:FG-GAP-like repeat-containing protein [Streptomyces sp. NPDC051976]|uniref:FG-GAP-like repeat-containing protein n=1 Tax=Streptomyces sp. NPDC051976 TaxID=3154947 RepID=UPI00344671F7
MPEYAPTGEVPVAAGTTGFLSAQPSWQRYGCDSTDVLRWTRYDSGASTIVSSPESASVCGTSTTGDAVYVQQVLSDGSYRTTEMSSGTSVSYTMPTGYRDLGLAGSKVVAGVVSDDGNSYAELHLLKPGATGAAADVRVTGLPEGATLPTSFASAIEASNGTQGALFFQMPDGTARLGVVDLATGVLHATSAAVQLGGQVQMDSSHVMWVTDRTTVHVLATVDLQAPEIVVPLDAVSFDEYAVTLAGNFVLAVRDQQYDSPRDPLGTPLVAYPLDGGVPQQLLQHAAETLTTGPDGGALAVGGLASTAWWVQRVSPDGKGGLSVTHAAQVPATTAALESLSAAGGVVVAAYDGTSATHGDFFAWSGTSASPELISNGLGAFPCGSLYGCRNQQVWESGAGQLDFRYGTNTVAIRRGLATLQLPSTAQVGDVAGAFGRYVLRTSTYGQSPQLEVDDMAEGPKTLLTRPAAPAALWGHLLYAADATPGEITVTDLRTQQTVRTVNVGSDCTLAFLQVVGNWLWRTCNSGSAATPFGVWKLDTDQLIPLPAKSAGPQEMLGDGYFVNQDSSRNLYLTDFHTGTAITTDLGVQPRQDSVGGGQRSPWTVDQYGGGLVYRAADDTVRMRHLDVPTSPLTAPDALVPPSLDRGTGTDTWEPTWWLSKPAASWKLTITDTLGRTVASESGGPTHGPAIAGSWNGTDYATRVSVAPDSYTWKLVAQPADGQGPALSQSGVVRVTGPIAGTTPSLLGEDSLGNLWQFDGGGESAPSPFRQSRRVGYGYQIYNKLTSMSGQRSDGTGDLVARDSTGVLWLYRGTGNRMAPLAARTRIGGGWNGYNQLVGTGDLTGDGRADLVARDSTGVLWLYRGTGSAGAPFAGRARIGAGWNAYNQIVGTGDLTDDGRADLVARDSTGVLWLYRGTGSAGAPFAARTRIGGGWNAYNLLVRAGDVDGSRVDLFARDASGALWFYAGTGIATAPFAPRKKIASGFDTYSTLL